MKRIRVVSVAALVLALPPVLAAQQAGVSQQSSANPITAAFRMAGTRYAGWLTAAFDSIPAGTYGFRPTPAQQSIGYVAQHIEDANYQLCSRFGGAPRVITARDSLADTVKAQWPKDTLVARLKASFTYCDQAMGRVDDANLSQEIPMGPPGSGRSASRARLVLIYVNDLVDHYSQIANYMRLNGMVPPSAAGRGRM